MSAPLVRAGLVVVLLALGAPVQAQQGKKYALLVGVTEYDSSTFTTLKYSENDAVKLAEVLKEAGYDEVVLLTTSKGKKHKNEAPTAANVRAVLDDLSGKVKKDDLLLVGLSGHGVLWPVLDDKTKKEKDESFFCPQDAKPRSGKTLDELKKTMIPIGELFRALDESGAGVRLMLVDACRNDVKGEGRNIDLDNLPRAKKGTAVLFSCKAGERAFEAEKLKHGVFFHYVIEGLKGEAKDKKGRITWSSLVEHVVEKVTEEVPTLIGGGAKQTPHDVRNFEGLPPLMVGPKVLDLKVQPAIKKALQDKRPAVRAKAAYDLGKLAEAADKDALKALCPLLKDQEPSVRLAAATALETLSRSAKRGTLEVALAPLLEVLGVEDEPTRKKALAALVHLIGPKHSDHALKLYPLLKSDDEETARGAAFVLGKMGGEPVKRAVPVLIKALAAKAPEVQAMAGASFASSSEACAEAVDDLARALSKSGDNQVRGNCCIALSRLKGEKGKPAIAALVGAMKAGEKTDSASEDVRELAVEAIALIGFPANESAIPGVRKAFLEDKNQRVRQRCVWALFSIEDLNKYKLVEPLTKVLDEPGDDKRLVRYDAARLLAAGERDKTPDKAVDVLLQMIGDDKLAVFRKTDTGHSGAKADVYGDARYMAAKALSWTGAKVKNNPKVVAALRKAAKDKDETLKREAEKALKALGE